MPRIPRIDRDRRDLCIAAPFPVSPCWWPASIECLTQAPLGKHLRHKGVVLDLRVLLSLPARTAKLSHRGVALAAKLLCMQEMLYELCCS